MIETKIMNLSAPFDYIYCNGELGKHIGTLIVTKATWNEEGEYELETHSHPIVQYWNSPKGTVWNQAELKDCEVLCNDDDKRIDIQTFQLLCYQKDQILQGEDDDTYIRPDDISTIATEFKKNLKYYGIGFKSAHESLTSAVFVGSCREGYYAETYDAEAPYFDIVEETLEKLAESLKEEREFWEDMYDHIVTIHYTPESSLATGFVENI